MLANETGQILATAAAAVTASVSIAQVMFGDHVVNQLHRIAERLVAPFALVRLYWFAGVEEHVLVQIRLLAVRFIADGASVLFVAGLIQMDFHVHGQAGRLRERFIALFARKRTFARVYSHVRVQ